MPRALDAAVAVSCQRHAQLRCHALRFSLHTADNIIQRCVTTYRGLLLIPLYVSIPTVVMILIRRFRCCDMPPMLPLAIVAAHAFEFSLSATACATVREDALTHHAVHHHKARHDQPPTSGRRHATTRHAAAMPLSADAMLR